MEALLGAGITLALFVAFVVTLVGGGPALEELDDLVRKAREEDEADGDD